MKKYGLYSIILVFLILGRIFIIPVFVSNENSSYVRIVRYQVLRDYPYYELIQGRDLSSAMNLSGYRMETIVALDVLLKNSFDLGKANEVASNQIVEITKKLDEGLLETTKAEIRDIYDFYHIKGIFTALLLNLIVILMIGIILFMLIEYFKEVKKSRR